MLTDEHAAPRALSRRNFLGLLAGGAVGLAAGCGSGQEASDRSDSIVFAVLPGYEKAIQAVADAYKKETGTTVEITFLPRNGYREALIGPLSSKSTSFDVLYIQDSWIAEFAQAGWISPIDSLLGRDQLGGLKEEIFPAAFENSYYNDALWGLPYDFSTFFFFYRRDLVSEPPKTMGEYLETAKELSKSQNPSSPLEFGTVLEGSPERVNTQEWLNFLWSRGGDVLDADNNPAFDSSVAAESLQWRYDQKLKHKVVPPDVDSYGYPEVLSSLQQEQAAVALQWNAAYPTLMDPEQSPKVADKLGATIIPADEGPGGELNSVPFSKYWLTAMNAFSQKQEEAARFIAFFAGTEAGKISLKNGGLTASEAAWTDPEIKNIRPDADLLVESLNMARVGPHIPEYPSIEDTLAKALSRVLSGQVDAQTALDNAAEKVVRELDRGRR